MSCGEMKRQDIVEPQEISTLRSFLGAFAHLIEDAHYDTPNRAFEVTLLEYDLIDDDLDYDHAYYKHLVAHIKHNACVVCRQSPAPLSIAFKLRIMRHQPPTLTDRFIVVQSNVEHTRYYTI